MGRAVTLHAGHFLPPRHCVRRLEIEKVGRSKQRRWSISKPIAFSPRSDAHSRVSAWSVVRIVTAYPAGNKAYVSFFLFEARQLLLLSCGASTAQASKLISLCSQRSPVAMADTVRNDALPGDLVGGVGKPGRIGGGVPTGVAEVLLAIFARLFFSACLVVCLASLFACLLVGLLGSLSLARSLPCFSAQVSLVCLACLRVA